MAKIKTMDQPKLERLLRLMKLLTANNYLAVEEIADRLSITPRSVYRYIDTFRSAGFVIKRRDGCIRLDKSSPYFKEISELIHFTEEEAYILKSAIESIDENNILKQNLKKKLYTVYDYKILAETIVHGKHSRNVHQLVHAMENRQSVILKKYASSHSNDIRDRRVEAFAFTTNYEQVWCYCLEEMEVKLFRVSRIGAVEVLPEPWQHAAEHVAGYIDIFRIHSNRKLPIVMKMGLRATSLLMEEFPLAAPQLQKLPDNHWLLKTEVCSYEGVGRFVLGLPGEIEIIETPEFLDYISRQLDKMKEALPEIKSE
jgi:predicted DNA-binding transcriptional regulator YafY